MFRLGEYICFSLAHYLLSRQKFGRYREQMQVGAKVVVYEEWRRWSLEKELSAFPQHLIEGKTILDFGCGGGQLSFLLRKRGAKRVIGVDLDLNALSVASRDNPDRDGISFLLGSSTTIPLPPESVDVVACLAVLEHVMDVDAILLEWCRILRPGGNVLIEWQPWYHPDGSHLGTVIPIPYAHCVFSERTLARVAYRIKQSEVYTPMFWDIWNVQQADNECGMPEQYCGNFLNKMSIAEFNRKLKKVPGLQVMEHSCIPPSWLPQVRLFLKMPLFKEFLSSYVTYVLTKCERE